MASKWKSFREKLAKFAREQGPGLIDQLTKSSPKPGPTPGPKPGRPSSTRTSPTAQHARTIEYSPDLDGRADPGEIVWTWVAFEEDPAQGKDRPVLVVGRNGATLLGLMLSSRERESRERDWVGIGAGRWDDQGRPSWVRLDRVIDIPEEGIRREGAIVDRQAFDKVAARLRSDFGWN